MSGKPTKDAGFTAGAHTSARATANESTRLPALSAINLSCGYPGTSKPILNCLNLAVSEGRLVCVIGPNGVGKSTLARTLAGLLAPMGGEVRLHDQRLTDLAPAERARSVSVVLTRLPVTGYMTVRNFVEIGRHPYTGTLGRMSAEDHDAVNHAISQIGMSELEDRWLNAISDGERQRAAIARAFAQAATLMILDEPTAFLDVEARAVVMTTLRRVAHDTGRTVIATSHDIDLVLRIADEIWMITPDRTVLTGAPEDLVLTGAMDQVFPNHVLRFDLKSGGFRLPHPTGREVIVRGDGAQTAWTARALERIGMRVIHPDVRATSGVDTTMPEVDAREHEAWSLRMDGHTHEFSSVANLVDHLRKS